MTPDLTKGELLIGDVLVTPDMVPDAFTNSNLFRTKVGSRFAICWSNNKIDIKGQEFKVEAHFNNMKLTRIKLTPVNLEIPNPGWPDEEYQAVRRAACDKWLEENIDDPVTIQREDCTLYMFDWGYYRATSVFEENRDPFSAGYIWIGYN